MKPIITTIAGLAAIGLASTAGAQQMGSTGYAFPQRSMEYAATAQLQMRLAKQAASGQQALQSIGSVTNNSSTSIGNLNDISQILDGGASGYLGLDQNQSNQGTQGSASTSSTTTQNTTVNHPTSTAQSGNGQNR